MEYARNAYDAHGVLWNRVPLLGGGGGWATSSQLGIQPTRLFHQGSHWSHGRVGMAEAPPP